MQQTKMSKPMAPEPVAAPVTSTDWSVYDGGGLARVGAKVGPSVGWSSMGMRLGTWVAFADTNMLSLNVVE